jgi:hypothetical protein
MIIERLAELIPITNNLDLNNYGHPQGLISDGTPV